MYDVKGVTLVVLEYSYEGVVTENGSGDETLIGSVSYRADKIVDRLVDLLRREVGGRGMGNGKGRKVGRSGAHPPLGDASEQRVGRSGEWW